MICRGGQDGDRELLRWTVLKRCYNETGKPFQLLRKVRDFGLDSDSEEGEDDGDDMSGSGFGSGFGIGSGDENENDDFY